MYKSGMNRLIMNPKTHILKQYSIYILQPGEYVHMHFVVMIFTLTRSNALLSFVSFESTELLVSPKLAGDAT